MADLAVSPRTGRGARRGRLYTARLADCLQGVRSPERAVAARLMLLSGAPVSRRCARLRMVLPTGCRILPWSDETRPLARPMVRRESARAAGSNRHKGPARPMGKTGQGPYHQPAGVSRTVRIWNGRSVTATSPSRAADTSAGCPASGRSSRSVTCTLPSGKPGRRTACARPPSDS